MTRSMTRSSRDDEPVFDIPDLEIGEPRVRRPSAPAPREEASEYQYEPLLERSETERSFELEDVRRDERRSERPASSTDRFVSGFATGGVPVSRFASMLPPPSLPREPLAPPTKLDVALDAIQTIPLYVWKRVPFYVFLMWLFGSCFRCGGLSRATNVAFGLLFVIGVVGVIGSLCQRRP